MTTLLWTVCDDINGWQQLILHNAGLGLPNQLLHTLIPRQYPDVFSESEQLFCPRDI